MKKNLPITGQEKIFPADKTLVSKTDTKGIITFVNRDFVDICGFSEKELVGTNHNIIRHPDMPSAAFEGMWITLKQGLPWNGLVKNRCKNGDHYWVDAKVVPIRKNSKIIGYMSVRTCPSRQGVENAQKAYQRMTASHATAGAHAPSEWKKHLTLKNGIPLWILIVTLMMIVGGALGVTGLTLSNGAIQTLYGEEMVPVQSIGRINFLMADNRAQVALALHHNPAKQDAPLGHLVSDHLQTLVNNRAEIDRLWTPYFQHISDATEKGMAERYWQARTRYVQDGLLAAKQALEASDYARAEQLLQDRVTPLYDQVNANVSVLLQHLSQRGESKFVHVTEQNRAIISVAIVGIALCSVSLAVAGVFFFRVTALPLHKAVLALENITEGNLSGDVDAGGYGEPARVMAAVEVMQMHLKVMMHEIRQSSDSIRKQCHHLNETMMNLAEHSDEQHDRVYQTLDAVSESCSGLRAMAAHAESLMDTVHRSETSNDQTVDDRMTGLEPMPSELLALFGDPATPTPDLASGNPTWVPAPELSHPASPAQENVRRLAHEVASSARVHAFAVEDEAKQLNQIAGLIVKNREEVQGAWAASQQLENTAREMEALIQYFE